MDNPFDAATPAYAAVRPAYPSHALDVLCTPDVHTAADIGAGTGKMTQLLLERGLNVHAVEPAQAMRTQIRDERGQLPPEATTLPYSPTPTSAAILPSSAATDSNFATTDYAPAAPDAGRGRTEPNPSTVSRLTLHATRAEDTGLPNASVNLVVYAQSWHWVNPEEAAAEAARILVDGGKLAAVWNQMDVSQPWVHRLSRIMRSGDVHRPDRPPRFGERFTPPQLTLVRWDDHVTPEELLELGTTRSSYLRSTPAGQEKMQDNLRWYLYEHLGYAPGQDITLPYGTLVWVSTLQSGE